MIIRNGDYTEYKNLQFALSEARHEAPIPFTHYILRWFLDKPCPLEEFELNIHGDVTKLFNKT